MAVLDDNGRYTKTLTPTDTYDYRVVFNSPANEGLEGDTSLVVRVSVSNGSGCGYGQTQIYIC